MKEIKQFIPMKVWNQETRKWLPVNFGSYDLVLKFKAQGFIVRYEQQSSTAPTIYEINEALHLVANA